MHKQLRQVLEFHASFDSSMGDVENKPVSKETKHNRIKLIREETAELIEAIESKSMREIAKELADVMYVLLGTIVSFGLMNSFERVFEAVHVSNMSKQDNQGKFLVSDDGSKILKGPHYQPPDLSFIEDK